MKRAASYARYSSDRQDERSIEDQHALNRSTAARHGIAIVAELSDRALFGAATVNRPGFLQVMRLAESGKIDFLLVEDQNRAFRNEADYHLARAKLEYYDVAIHNMHGPIGRVEGSFQAIMDAMALEKLATHVRRGLTGVAKSGRSAGGRCFGYRSRAGQVRGVLEIVEDEAAVVRRIFAEYIAGRSPRTIAAALNREGVPGPRGGVWNASSIAGSSKRQNGILNNPLYDGRSVWNRQQFRKHPDSRKRISRANNPAARIETPVEHLRIVAPDVFARAQQRKRQRLDQRHDRSQPRHLLSGLIKCAACGSSYVVVSRDKRGQVLGCTRAKESGTCDNRRTIAREMVETRVLEGIAQNLGHPDLIAAYVREYHRRLEELHTNQTDRERALRRRLSEVLREGRRLVDPIAKGTPARMVNERLAELETKRMELEAAMESEPPAPVQIHPRAAEAYRTKIANLKAALAEMDSANRAEAVDIIRDLVERIVIRHHAPYAPVDIEVHGRLAGLLAAKDPAAASATGSRGVLVAGARNHLNLLFNAPSLER